MANAVTNIIKVPELRNRILYVLGMLILFRIGSHITIPGINPYPLAHMDPGAVGEGGATDSILNMIDLFAGGAFRRFSIFSLGIMPYISASIIMQLLMVVIPSLQRMQREGDEGRKKITQYTRYGTIVLCAVQSIGVLVLASKPVTVNGQQIAIVSEQVSSTMFYVLGITSIVAGTMLLMWMGEQMTEKGIGNGISLLIFAGIVVRMPESIVEMVQTPEINLIRSLILIFIFIVLIILSIYLTQGTRKVPLQYGKRMQGRRMVQAQNQTLPFKVNSANVMPIIFASSLMLFPQTMGSMIAGLDEQKYAAFATIARLFSATADFPGVLVYYITYSAMIVFFAYFYTAIQYNPDEIAENLKKFGGFIPGIRPGSHTRDYIQRMLNRITLPGSIFLAGIAIAPQMVNSLLNLPTNLSISYTFGGTSLLIMVGVALEVLKQIEAQLIMRHYDGFMKKGKIRGRAR